MFYIGLISAAFWGAGTNLLDERWYIVHGLSLGDLLFAGWVVLAVGAPRQSRRLVAAFRTIREHTALVTTFVLLLLLSLVVNGFRYGAEPSDLFAILRLLYFTVIITFTIAHVREFGPWPILLAFVGGILALAVGRVHDVLTGTEHIVVGGLPVLKDQNVIGNMMGIGVALSSLGVLMGRTRVSLLLAVGFAAVSVLTFSKAAWLMVSIGLASNFIALVIRYPLTPTGLRRLFATSVGLAVLIGWLVYANVERLNYLLTLKLRSSPGTTSERYQYAVAGVYAMGEHPLVGVGFRNYTVVRNLYPEIVTGEGENAHSVFVQIGAVGGIPALGVFMLLFVYPFVDLWRLMRDRGAGLRGVAYVLVTGLLFLVGGAVQLQLMAQPFFWFFTGLVRGWRFTRVPELPALARPSSVPVATVPLQ